MPSFAVALETERDADGAGREEAKAASALRGGRAE